MILNFDFGIIGIGTWVTAHGSKSSISRIMIRTPDNEIHYIPGTDIVQSEPRPDGVGTQVVGLLPYIAIRREGIKPDWRFDEFGEPLYPGRAPISAPPPETSA